jgi:AcrR family transcriptional regulator
MTSSTEPPLDGRTRRRIETRRRLVASARGLFADEGIDAVRINEITEAAGVGFGSFYNHFESKDAIVAAVVEEVATELGQAIERATADLDDPAEVVAVAHRTIVERCAHDHPLGWLLVRLDVTHDIALQALAPFAARDLDRGVAAGRFVVDHPASVLIASGGALLAVVRAVLRSADAVDAGEVASRHAALMLVLFGVPAAEADAIARRPLPSA